MPTTTRSTGISMRLGRDDERLPAAARQADRSATAARRSTRRSARFETFLDRHLTDEEDLVVPVILTYAPNLH
jgi:hypothetical protein